TYTDDFTIVMTISQGGTGSGASGPAVRNIYDALYGLDDAGNQDLKRALLPKPQKALPKVNADGTIDAPVIKAYDPKSQLVDPAKQNGAAPPPLAGTPPNRRD
ncbi:penicillin-binding protein 2, partial [Streptomyces anthocyanicus]